MDIAFVTAIRSRPNHPEPLDRLYREYIDETVYAEELGFDSVWVGEHHFAEDAWTPSPLPVLAAIAERTSRVKLGSFILVLPLYNPVRVAEDAAIIDLISGGRFNLGVGVGGWNDHEFRPFGLPSDKRLSRMYESLDIITRCFGEETFDYDGQFFTLHDVNMTTKSLQKPHPPIWIAAIGPKSVELAAAAGYHSLGGSIPGYAPRYREAATAAGHDGNSVQVSTGPVWIHLAETREKAWDQAEEAMHWTIEFYRRANGDEMVPMMFGLPSLPPVGELRNAPSAYGSFTGVSYIVGTPEDALASLSMYSEAGLDQLAFHFHLPGLPTGDVRRSMELFTDQVMPALRDYR